MLENFFSIKKFNKIVVFGFFTSKGGVSKNEYFSLNCGQNGKDNRNNINKNINIALKKLGIENKNLKLINQIHSNKVFDINRINLNKNLFGDGLITKDKNISIGILTADCAPILIFDTKQTIACCLHSGWKGTLSNIVSKSIQKFRSNNVNEKDIIAVIGPCLGFKSYEVDKNFKLKFEKKNKSYLKYFKYKNKYKDYFDLRGIINYQLKKESIRNIYNIKKDTYSNKNNFFSHRRAVHQNRTNTGRMINIIALKD